MRRLLPGMVALGAVLMTAPAQASFTPEGSPLAVGAAQPYGVLTADFNRDGRVDAATVNGTGSNLSVLLRGPASFASEPGSPFPVGPGPGYGAVADFNGDLYPDVATQNFNDGTVSVMIRQAAGGFTAEPSLSVGSGTGSVASVHGSQNGASSSRSVAQAEQAGGNSRVSSSPARDIRTRHSKPRTVRREVSGTSKRHLVPGVR